MSDRTEPPRRSDHLKTASEDENSISPTALRNLSRSPHPYHRTHSQILDSLTGNADASAVTKSSDGDLATANVGFEKEELNESSTAHDQARKTSSDSGSDADDESYSFVRALPAAPIKLHKGLKSQTTSGIDGEASPLLTPSQLDSEGERIKYEYFKTGRNGSREQSLIDDEVATARKKYIKKRKAELLRRSTEVSLLGVIGVVAFGGSTIRKTVIEFYLCEFRKRTEYTHFADVTHSRVYIIYTHFTMPVRDIPPTAFSFWTVSFW
jgi:hypothetical protein